MPAFCLKCKECGVFRRKLAKTWALVNLKCPDCDGEMERAPEGPATQVMESLDNGVMVRRVERFRDAERMYKERAASADPLAGTGRRNYD